MHHACTLFWNEIILLLRTVNSISLLLKFHLILLKFKIFTYSVSLSSWAILLCLIWWSKANNWQNATPTNLALCHLSTGKIRNNFFFARKLQFSFDQKFHKYDLIIACNNFCSWVKFALCLELGDQPSKIAKTLNFPAVLLWLLLFIWQHNTIWRQ